MNPKAVLEFAAANNVKFVDIRFTDLPGLWQHVSFPIHELDESSFEDGFGMDGSSIRGWAAIHESDMLLVPDPSWYIARPVHRDAHPGDDWRHHRPRDASALCEGSPQYRQEGRELPRLLRGSRIRPISARKPSSSFLTTSGSIRPSSTASTLLTRKRGAGTPAARRTTWVTGPATRKAISPFRPPIITRTCAARWFWPWKRPGLRSSATTTKWPPAGRPRSTRDSTRW